VKTKFLGFALLLSLSSVALAEKVISLEELSKHSSETDCWMAIDGAVYDMSQYIKLHQEECKKMKFVDYCGVDASEVWKKTESGKSPHKKKSYRSLEKAKVGQLTSK
jgi:cytochrome b involved in lipid metabolism